MNGPQFGWINPSYVYGVGLHGAGFDVVGNTLLAYPFMLFSHNSDISWGSTAGFGDLVDIYVSRLNPENPGEYFYKGEYRALEVRQDTIHVKGEVSKKQVFFTVQFMDLSVQVDEEADLIYSKKRSWEGHEVETSVAWVEMSKTRNFSEWRKQLSRMATNINFYFLDKNGSIGYTHTGKYPLRHKNHDNRPAGFLVMAAWTGSPIFHSCKTPMSITRTRLTSFNWNKQAGNTIGVIPICGGGAGVGRNVLMSLSRNLKRKSSSAVQKLWDINSRFVLRRCQPALPADSIESGIGA